MRGTIVLCWRFRRFDLLHVWSVRIQPEIDTLDGITLGELFFTHYLAITFALRLAPGYLASLATSPREA